jgi:hypothetical protein
MRGGPIVTSITLELPDDLAIKTKTLSPQTLAELIRKALSVATDAPAAAKPKNRVGKLYGKYAGQFWMSPEFNAPLEDFVEYM